MADSVAKQSRDNRRLTKKGENTVLEFDVI
jgi:hypothetical protein